MTRQVSYFSADSWIEALDASGTIVFATGSDRYQSSPPYSTATALGNAIGEVRVRDGRFVILLAGSVFVFP